MPPGPFQTQLRLAASHSMRCSRVRATVDDLIVSRARRSLGMMRAWHVAGRQYMSKFVTEFCYFPARKRRDT
jgi:hypothetical protein